MSVRKTAASGPCPLAVGQIQTAPAGAYGSVSSELRLDRGRAYHQLPKEGRILCMALGCVKQIVKGFWALFTDSKAPSGLRNTGPRMGLRTPTDARSRP